MADEALDELGGGGDPAGAGAGGDDLGEGVEAHNAAVDVEAHEGGDEALQELLVGGGGWEGGGGGAGVGLHLEEVVGLVFDNEDAVLLADLVELLAAGEGHRRAGGVLARGDGVQEMRLLGASRSAVPVGEDLIHVVWHQTLAVHLDPHDLDPERHGRLYRRGERVLLGEHVISSLAEHAVCLLQRHGASHSQHALPVRIRRVAHNLCVLGDEPEQLGGAAGLAVVERDGEVVDSLAFGDVVLAYCGGGTLRLGLFLGEVGRGREAHVDLVDGEVLGAWEAAAEGDHARVLEVSGRAFERSGLSRPALLAENVCYVLACCNGSSWGRSDVRSHRLAVGFPVPYEYECLISQ